MLRRTSWPEGFDDDEAPAAAGTGKGEDARRLGRIVSSGPFKLNLIPYNAGRQADFDPVGEEQIQHFIQLSAHRSTTPNAMCSIRINSSLPSAFPANSTSAVSVWPVAISINPS